MNIAFITDYIYLDSIIIGITLNILYNIASVKGKRESSLPEIFLAPVNNFLTSSAASDHLSILCIYEIADTLHVIVLGVNPSDNKYAINFNNFNEFTGLTAKCD